MKTTAEIEKIINKRKYHPQQSYHVPIAELEADILSYEHKNMEVQLNPEFQRGRVWTQQQSIAYVEAFLADKLPEHIKAISFNRIYNNKSNDERLNNKMLCIDGLQRLNSMLSFVRGEFNVFDGQISYQDCIEHNILTLVTALRFEIYEIKDYNELLKFYIDMNSGGTVHSKDEIERVRKLITS